MVRYIVLLRGVNLGARNRIAMPELRESLVGLGYDDVRTHLQSGNVLLSRDASPERVARDCERLIADRFSIDVPVVVRTRDELAAVVRRDPLGDVAVDAKRYQVSFLGAELDPGVVPKLSAATVAPEQFVVIGREIYAWHPDGIGRSRLAVLLSGRGLGVTATARNWVTVTSLLAMADG